MEKNAHKHKHEHDHNSAFYDGVCMNHPRHHTIKKQPSNVDDKQFLDPVPTSRPRRRGRRAAEVYELGADIAALQRRER